MPLSDDSLEADRSAPAANGATSCAKATAVEKALSRFTVIDLTRVRAGPTAVKQLADWGATVIKVETPVTSDGTEPFGGSRHGFDFQNLHRNKRSLTLNLKHEDGLAVFRKLVERADVVVENFRPEVKYRLGIDYEKLNGINSRLVYASISGFGEKGPYRDRPGVDQIAQGMGGLMSITGEPGRGPMRVGIPITDLAAGLFCALGILTALHEREMSGQGQWVQTSLLQAQIAMLDFQAARYLIEGEVPAQAGNNHPTSIPTGLFKTKDGHINIGASGGTLFARFAKAIGEEKLPERHEFSSFALRLKHRDALNAIIGKRLAERTTTEWIEVINQAGVPCGPVNSIDQVFADPQVRQLAMTPVVEQPALGPIRLVGQGFQLARTPCRVETPAPEPGQHSDAILRELGYAHAEIARLRKDGTV